MITSDSYGPDGFTVSCAHDGVPMTFKGAKWSWEGDYSICHLRFYCDCGLTADVVTREMDGGPDVVRARAEGGLL